MSNGSNDGGTLRKVIFASSAGTLIEWYDFFVFASLATVLATKFFPKDNPTVSFLLTLATFSVGFVVRPFGAVIFGRMGDAVGRKVTFLLTLMMMGLSTFAIGLVPSYSAIGVAAPLIVLVLRLLQGFAIGGEYGGAATYVAEHAPANRRGYCTSFIQSTGMLGFLASLLATLGTRTILGEQAFGEYGWRIPFLLSIVLVVLSFLARRRMDESPIFARAKSAGQLSGNPVRDSFADPANRRLVLIALFGALNGQAVTWYTGHLYSLYFMQTVLHFQNAVATRIIVVALVVTAPCYMIFGSLSDRIGRKKLIVTASLCAGVTYLPIYALMLKAGTIPNAEKIAGGVTPPESTVWLFTALILFQVMIATIAYAPTAAFLVELFPTRIRYTSVSLPHHIANGIFGGLVPLIGTAMVTATGNKLAGVWFPTVMVLSSAVVGAIFIRERRTAEGFAELA